MPQPFSAWGVSQSCYDVGGDAYDALMLSSGECAFWVADVSGKGIGAALLMTTLQTELRSLVRAESDLARLATELDARIEAVAPLGTFATLFLGVLSPEEERLRYINAGHVPPVWLNSQSESERTFEVSGKLLGLPLPDNSYNAGEVAFRKGERLAIFSDGVTEAENTAGETFEETGTGSEPCAHQSAWRLSASASPSLQPWIVSASALRQKTIRLIWSSVWIDPVGQTFLSVCERRERE